MPKIFSGAAVAIVTGTTMAATASTNAATFAMNLRSRLIGGILSIHSACRPSAVCPTIGFVDSAVNGDSVQKP